MPIYHLSKGPSRAIPQLEREALSELSISEQLINGHALCRYSNMPVLEKNARLYLDSKPAYGYTPRRAETAVSTYWHSHVIPLLVE